MICQSILILIHVVQQHKDIFAITYACKHSQLSCFLPLHCVSFHMEIHLTENNDFASRSPTP